MRRDFIFASVSRRNHVAVMRHLQFSRFIHSERELSSNSKVCKQVFVQNIETLREREKESFIIFNRERDRERVLFLTEETVYFRKMINNAQCDIRFGQIWRYHNASIAKGEEERRTVFRQRIFLKLGQNCDVLYVKRATHCGQRSPGSLVIVEKDLRSCVTGLSHIQTAFRPCDSESTRR